MVNVLSIVIRVNESSVSLDKKIKEKLEEDISCTFFVLKL